VIVWERGGRALLGLLVLGVLRRQAGGGGRNYSCDVILRAAVEVQWEAHTPMGLQEP